MEIQGFDNIEDMFAAIEGSRSIAKSRFEQMPSRVRNSLKAEEQKYVQDSGYGFLIFGEAKVSEHEEDREMDAEQPWYQLVRAYSSACPDGELGTTPVCDMTPISDEMFENAKAAGWDAGMLDMKEFYELVVDEITSILIG